MRRSLWLPFLFAAAVVLVIGGAATWTIGRLERSLDEDLGRRLESLATAVSTTVEPATFLELEAEGPDGLAYGEVLVRLELVRRVAGAENVFLIARDGTVAFDLLREEAVGEPSAFFEAERAAATTALAGSTSSTRLYRAGEFLFKTGFAPLRSTRGEVLGVVGVETDAEFLGIIRETRANLLLTLVPAIVAVFLLSALFVRLSLTRQRLEREFARAENLAAVGELAATLAHEVRNPLGVIKRSAERLKRRYQGEERELLDYITDECDRLARTVRRYLDFARPAPHGEHFGDAAEVTRATAALLERECADRGVALETEIEGQGPWLVALGSEELKQILLNLLRNSLEALSAERGEAPEGSEPAAGVPGEPRPRIRVGLAGERRRVLLALEDNGPGMDPETLRRSREPFFTTRAQGSGLGLAIVDRLVREVGGRVRIVSRRDRGTRIELHLPRARRREESAA